MTRTETPLQSRVLLRQATLRVATITLVMVVVVGLLALWFQDAAMDKATDRIMTSLKQFYAEKIVLWEQEWQEQATTFHNRLELHHIFDVPGREWEHLREILNQEGNIPFPVIIITDASQRILFRQEESPMTLPEPEHLINANQTHWFEDQSTGILYRLIAQPLWLGSQGNGELILFIPIENGMLFHNALPFTDLLLLHHGRINASSLGHVSPQREDWHDGTFWQEKKRIDQLSIPWDNLADHSPRLVIRYHSEPLFSIREILVVGLTVFAMLSLLFWYTLGLWIVRLTRRITLLGWVARAFSNESHLTPDIKNALDEARHLGHDEVAIVADAMMYAKESVARELQAREIAQVNLQKISNHNQLLLEAAGEGIYGLDKEGRTTFINPAATRMIGWNPGEVMGQTLHDIMHHTHSDNTPYPQEECLVNAAIRTGEIQHVTNEIFWRKDHTRFPVEYVSTPIFDDGTILGAVVVFRDISERIQAEKQAQSYLIYQRIVNSLYEISYARISLQAQLERALDCILSVPWLAIQAKGAVFLVNKQQTPTLRLTAHRGFDSELLSLCKNVPYGHCLCGRAALTQTLIHAHCVDDRHDIAFDGMLPHGHYSVPILSGEDLLGVLTLYLESGQIRDPEDENLMQIIGNTLGSMIERKRLEESLQNQNSLLEEKVLERTTELQDYIVSLENIQAAIHEANKQQQAIFDAATIGITFIRNRVFEKCNRRFQELLGYGQTELYGQSTRCLYPDEKSHSEIGLAYADLDRGEVHQRIQEIRRKDGSLFWCHMSGSAIVPGDLSRGTVWTLADVTREREALEVLRQGKAMAESAARMKAEFLATMSHEIRTPMNAIIGFAEVVFQDASLSPSTAGHVQTILGSARALLGILNDILDVSKLESGRFSLENRCFNLRNAVAGALQTLDHLVADKPLTMTFELDPTLPIRVMGDPTRLRQVILNLVGNAVKFTEQGGIRVVIRRDPAPDLLHVTVSDSGIGMTPEQLTRAFDPFTQADQSISRRFGGTGLGTTLSRQIVELMGGRIWVESQINVGSAFHFTVRLPEAASREGCLYEEEAIRVADYRSPRRFRILLAEDLKANATLVLLRLKQVGHEVEWVKNGREAVAACCAGRYDLVLMDVMMPEMDGLEATRTIREKEREKGTGRAIPILALTASVMREDNDRCQAAGMDAVLAKPIDFDQLLMTLEAIVPQGAGQSNDVIPAEMSQSVEVDFTPLAGLVDHERALRVWRDPVAYVKALMSFAAERSRDAEVIADRLAEQPDDAELAQALIHTLKGLAGNLTITRVACLATELEDLLRANPRPNATLKLNDLRQSLAEAVAAIGRLRLPCKGFPDLPITLNVRAIRELLSELLAALDELNPDSVEPLLARLTGYIATTDLVPLQTCLAAFDFVGARQQVLILAECAGVILP